ncbi:MAG: PD-(D/E)XK nuclease family protein, partial [Clostridia bacterium]|nr:PD-(D/E)XK nuclease family protein [Clostridia bacterium]
SPPDIGTFMHAVIERFSRLVSKGDITWRSFDREWCSQKVSEIVDEMLAKMQGSGLSASKRYVALASRLKRVVTRAVWLIAEHIRRSGFEPIDYEAGFGDNEKYPPITIELDSGAKINLTGRIDRIDALKTEDGMYLRIIDYKSGAKDFRLSDVYYGLQIQLITYLDAIWEHTGKSSDKEVHPGGMLYFKIDDPIIRGGSVLTEEEIEAAIMRQLKMKGLLLADVKLIKEMDRQIDGSSMIIPATVNKGDVLGKNTSGATLEQFKLLRTYVRRLLKGLCTEIMKGKVDIRPYKKKGATSCQYCSFSSVCQFDTGVKDNTYKLLYDRESEEVWELMNEPE